MVTAIPIKIHFFFLVILFCKGQFFELPSVSFSWQIWMELTILAQLVSFIAQSVFFPPFVQFFKNYVQQITLPWTSSTIFGSTTLDKDLLHCNCNWGQKKAATFHRRIRSTSTTIDGGLLYIGLKCVVEEGTEKFSLYSQNSWFKMSFLRYSLSDCGNFKPHHRLA
jgi:hypothetical protein